MYIATKLLLSEISVMLHHHPITPNFTDMMHNKITEDHCIGSSTSEQVKFLISYQWNNHKLLSLFAIFSYICILGSPQLMWSQV